MKDDIKELKRRAGITESQPLLMMLLQGVKEYADIASRQGEEAAAQALHQKGFKPEQIEALANAYRSFVERTGNSGF